MHRLTNKQVILGITGGIAAYKSAELTRHLKAAGADVRVVMTPAATEFITPLTLQALSGNPVHTQLLDPEAEAGMGHIELARWADIMVIAPASADFMARLASGMGNDLLTTLCLATDAPICLAPAMNQAMWRSAQTQRNAETLSAQGIKLWGPGIGDQACGDTGPGRMLEPLDIAARTAASFETGSLAGLRLTITAGPTREPLDPVRYISNHSSGKMGFSLAQAAVSAGAHVTLISGPVNLATPDHVTRLDINSAQDMLQAAESDTAQCDIFIACAAVADYRPSAVAEHKIKKGKEEIMELHLIKNPDIVATIASKVNAPFTVGFAAETRDIVSYAQDKLVRKKLDLIIANDVSRTDIGFNSDDNAVTLVTADQVTELPMMRKRQLATSLIDHIAQLYKANR
ncbi:bifunctional phosphopantothenoylcysteine decarboxylase/phosphopantothenate--cysteine ligase CoaBC [Neptunomonas phycophila]|uniref:Coenzyme A biosynthesis bifunctional protein CoaBC n=1 Tax=Neptunomonas phycophila TaxID=1572645 RepID=A0AAW7XNG8_9GAMM|nr:bifunctional phosphopantothenoylcysteine decarboxylase/phosphopantothenate--cysteine ligase CoaBC [Neptunomonas phycophila]MDO6455296.1 bifunctional phosphopantothenoylcysteine decarboxylase/phosphopantothenate--cysteine ligase CoaBC [Neptunomonas phycophila]MDO6469881.1 bifunctional phosphopantothenoylcysteine decarboxylase/phosphopantothenate--cysteine ligase CoaBC [Neptunomonas phycophila]MDP2524239.1 bifunctional phosphopantothenoylcysteine decarboxylase/phosphopantothenate--cysteine liga